MRFRPLSAVKTPAAMEELCNYLNRKMKEENIDLLIGAFVLDFLSIHPFNDGNGRMTRLLTLLLLYKYDYKIGRYISLEKVIEESKSNYYKALNKSSVGWHEGDHDLFIWLDYFLGTLLAAYRKFEDRVGLIRNKKLKEEEVIELLGKGRNAKWRRLE